MNSFYNHSLYPTPNAPGSSAAMRNELDLISAAFDKMPTLAGNAGKLVRVSDDGTTLVAGGQIESVDFKLTGIADAVGRLTWNDTDGTLNLGLKGGNVVLQVGQEEVLRVLNNTGSTLTSGQVVYITGASGQRPTVALAQANNEPTSTKVLGIVTETIANNAQGFVTTSGLVRDVDTSSFAEGALLWLSATTPGAITSTKPTQPNHSVLVGYCVRANPTGGIIYTMVQNGYELDELHDVLITSLANNNMLKWDAGSSVWRNVAGPAGAVVGTTDTQTLTNKTISGGTVTGATVTSLPAPSAASDATTKSYVDAADALKLNLSGGTMSGAIAMGTNKITGLGTPTADADAATKAYVDGVAQGLDVKGSVVVATTANITLSGTQTIDGVAVSAGQRVLVKDQTAQAENGIYLVAAGSWTRTTDMDAWTEFPGAFVFVEQGTVNDNSGWVCTVSAGGTLGSTAVTFEQFSGAGQITAGAGLTKSGNTLNVGTASSARIVVNADNIDLATTGVAASTYRSVTVDAYGRVTAGTNPTTISGYSITDAYTKTEVDNFVNAKLNLSGGTMTGNIAMGGNLVTGLGAPVNDNDAVRLKYVTDLFGSTASAASSAADALSYRNAAQTAASNAATSESNALTYKNAAQTSASNAATSESNALASAIAAAASYDSFDDRYLGAKSTPPTVDNDGNALIVGALYFDTTSNLMKVYTTVNTWVNAGTAINGTSNRATYTATAGQTTFAIVYDVGYVDVWFNGLKLVAGTDFTATNGTTIVLATGATAGDIVDIIAYGTFTLADFYSKTQSDVRYLQLTGGTLTGALTMQSNLVFDGNSRRITGDFSNATLANRVMFQTSTANSNTGLGAIPSGTGNSAGMRFFNSSDITNSAALFLVAGTDASIQSIITGTGTYLPMTFYTSGSEKLRIAADTTGTYTFGGTAPRITGDFSNATVANRVSFQTSTVNGATVIQALTNGTGNVTALQAYPNNNGIDTPFLNLVQTSSQTAIYADRTGSGSFTPLTLNTGGSERMRIDTSGNVGIGTSSPSALLDVNSGGVTAYASPAANFLRNHGAQSYSNLNGLQIYWNTSNGSGESEIVYGNLSTAYLRFIQNNAGTFTERARIDSSGNLLVNRTTQVVAEQFGVGYDGSVKQGVNITDSSAAATVTMMGFYKAGAQRGTIQSTSTSTSYGTSSDYRLKENVQPMTGALAKVAALKPCTYKWKIDGSDGEGFIAHELAEVCPQAVVGEKDAVNEDGSIKPQGIDTSFLVATLTAAIQEQQAMIEELKAKVAALESK